MIEELVKPGWETFLIGIPLILILLMGVFRLDEVFMKPKKKPVRKPPPPRGRAGRFFRTRTGRRLAAGAGTETLFRTEFVLK
jgi:hypothetical protein